MSNRERVIELLKTLPEDMPTAEIVRQLCTALKVPESLGAAEGLSMEEFRKFLAASRSNPV